MANMIWGIIGFAVLLHGFFYVRYGSPHPCEAAVARMNEENPGAGIGFGIALELAKGFGGMNAKVVAECYRIAILGTGGMPAKK